MPASALSLRTLFTGVCLLALGGCASLAPPRPAAAALPEAPPAWQAPLPHGGQVTQLSAWWQQFSDPLLTQLMASAQDASPSLAAARTRIAEAQALRVSAGAALLPNVNASASVSRGRPDLSAPVGTSAQAGLQAGWELDLFGGAAAGRDAASARVAAAHAGWHDARVSVAAEVALQYTALKACEAQLEQVRLDATSRAETSRLTTAAADAGMQPPAQAALARASAAQGNSLLTQQKTACAQGMKALAALSGMDEATLRGRWAASGTQLPQPAQFSVTQVPAEALAQRPDVLAAEREVLASAADVNQAQAQRYPRISLSGNIGAARFSTAGSSLDGTVWSLGPLTVSLPLFDGGTRRANADAAEVRHEQARVAYAARLRQAVREVEEALITLQSTTDRGDDAQVATEGFNASYQAALARQRGGLASLFELEDARRTAVQAQSALIELQRERVAAWIMLYRALGGGWTPATHAAAAAAASAH